MAKAKTPTNRPSKSLITKWWQWIIMYPALAVALVSAVPNWVDSYTAWQQGINLEQLPSAMEQNTFWKANLECMTAPCEWVAKPSNVKVDGTICPSGNIMIRISTPN